jgi:putative nucleotidyltransferase with HDIG domain
MTEADIRPLRRWFKEYVQSFYSPDVDIQAHVRLKEEHTVRVCDRMAELSVALRLADEQAVLAETVALFHDVGRFQQYTQYRTFNDFRSEDHACLGVRILRQTGILSTLPQSQQELVQKAVRYHNGRDVPKILARRSIWPG